MDTRKARMNRNLAGVVFVVIAIVLLITGLLAQAKAQDLGDDRAARRDGTVYDSEFLGGLWSAHDGPDARTRNFFPFYYEAGEKGSSTWSSPLLLSGGRTRADGSEEVRLLGGIIRHSIDRDDR